MGGTTDKAARIANEAIGKAKQGIGSVVGSDRLQAEGAAQETKGDTQKAAGDAKDAIKTSVNKVASPVNKNRVFASRQRRLSGGGLSLSTAE